MPDQRESGQRVAGRLYATLRVLKFLVDSNAPKPSVEDTFGGKDRPRKWIQDLELNLLDALVTAVQKGRHAKAASEVFRALPALIPSQAVALDKNLSPPELAAFNAGHRAQLTSLKETFPELVD
ncbi:hypothetical protein [Streptomyces sp. BK79]|uniref:hypothetical protein n=1 Tax=Streptomyces sp. BK79 TaxID=3350097 RepID=UPI00376F60C9